MTNSRTKDAWWRGLAGAVMAAAGCLAAMPAGAWASPSVLTADDEEDVIILKAGNTEIRGQILAETDTTLTFKGKMSGITIEKEFAKSDLLSIKRGKKADAKAPAAAPGGKTAEPAKAGEPAKSDDGKKKIYVIDMAGEFGVDVSQTPIRNAVKDAQNVGADVIICVLDCKPAGAPGEGQTPPGVEELFDEIFRSEFITPIFVEEIPRDWKPKPRLVFWVKNAIGGSAMLPFVCPEVYMSSEAFWGGIANLTNQFDGVGDPVVQHKQYSLRLGHAQGWAITGGYYPELINAMAARDYVMSYKIVGDKVEFYNRMPDPLKGEILLTDDGAGPNQDTVKDVLENRGNDCLTFSATLARDLQVSKGTVDKLDDLIFQLGYERTGTVVPGKSKKITDGWKREVVTAKKDIRKAIQDYRDVRVEQPGDFQARTKARSARINFIRKILSILDKYSEAMTPRWRGQNGIPPDAQLRLIIDNIQSEQRADSPDGGR